MEKKTATRTWKFEIVKFHGDRKEITGRWMMLKERTQQLCNEIMLQWIDLHRKMGSFEKAHKWRAEYVQWLNETKGTGRDWKKAPKLDFHCWEFKWDAEIKASCVKKFQDIPARQIEQFVRGFPGKLKANDPNNTGLQVWQSVLCSLRGNSGFGKQNVHADFRLSGGKRIGGVFEAVEGKSTFKMSVAVGRNGAKNLYDDFEIKAKKGGYTTITKIVNGTYKFRCVQLSYEEFKNKWFAHITFDKPIDDVEPMNPENVATLTAGKDEPWILEIGDRKLYPGGYGDSVAVNRERAGTSMWPSDVAEKREKYVTERFSRQEGYRLGSSPSRKGHGRNRALARLPKMRIGWNNFVKNHNRNCALNVARLLKEHGCGTLVIQIPDEKEELFLWRAGKLKKKDGTLRSDPTGWQFAQIEIMLTSYGQEYGFAVGGKKRGKKKRTRQVSSV